MGILSRLMKRFGAVSKEPPAASARFFGRSGMLALGVALVATTGAAVGSDLGLIPGPIGAPETTIVIERAPDWVSPDVRLAVLGDVGTGEAGEWATAGLVAEAATVDPFDGLILLGDNVYPNGDPARLDATVFGPFGPVLDQGTALLPVLGNHDVQDGHGDAQVAAFGLPGRWWASEIGPVLIVGLDSTRVDDSGQLAWLEATLRRADADWVIVAMHHPPYSAGSHGSNEEVRDAWVPIFERHGVDLVLAGHDHDYQRTEVLNGVTYIVSGGGADVRPTDRADFTAYAASTLHYVDVSIWSDRLEAAAYSALGPFDHVVIYAAG